MAAAKQEFPRKQRKGQFRILDIIVDRLLGLKPKKKEMGVNPTTFVVFQGEKKKQSHQNGSHE